MSNLFSDSQAFRAFFVDALVVSGARGEKHAIEQTIPACVFEESDADAVSDLSLDSTVRTITATFEDETWRYYGERLRLGDEVRYDNVRYKVTEVKHDAINGWQIKAREAK